MNLKEIRKQKGASQADVAQAVGVTASAVSSWESGRFDPTMNNLIRIAEFLKCSLDDLIGSKEANDTRRT